VGVHRIGQVANVSISYDVRHWRAHTRGFNLLSEYMLSLLVKLWEQPVQGVHALLTDRLAYLVDE
jgi:hypothetical protein